MNAESFINLLNLFKSYIRVCGAQFNLQQVSFFFVFPSIQPTIVISNLSGDPVIMYTNFSTRLAESDEEISFLPVSMIIEKRGRHT